MTTLDMSDVLGQAHAKRAAEVATAGGFALALIGPPNSAKSMIAERMPSIGGRADQVTDLRPCECGYLGHVTEVCHCNLAQVTRYRKQRAYHDALLKARMIAETTPFRADDALHRGESSAVILARVLAARVVLEGHGLSRPGGLGDVPLMCMVTRLDMHAAALLKQAAVRLPLDGLQYDSVLRLAVVIAALDGQADKIQASHVAEAVQYQRRGFK